MHSSNQLHEFLFQSPKKNIQLYRSLFFHSFMYSKTITNSIDINANSIEANNVRISGTTSAPLLAGKDINGQDILTVSAAESKVTIAGDMHVMGNLTWTTRDSFSVEDPIIKLAENNAANVIDTGFFAQYAAPGTKYKGMYFDASNNDTLTAFKNLSVEPSNVVNDSHESFQLADAKFANVAGTMTTAAQPNITSLAGLTSIQGQAINATQWPKVAAMQDISPSDSPQFHFLNLTASLNGQVGGNQTTMTRIDVNSLGDSAGDVNTGSAGVYAYNGASRYVRFNSSGGGNDLLSSGAVLIMNYNDPNGARPQDIECFGNSSTSTPSNVFVNGNLLLSNGGAYAPAEPPSRRLCVKAGPFQSTTRLLDIVDAAGNPIVYSTLTGFNTNFGTSSGGQNHLIMRVSNGQRFGIGLTATESGSNNGSNFNIFSYADNGSFLANPFSIRRSDSQILMAGPVLLTSAQNDTLGNLTSNTFTPTLTNSANTATLTNQGSSYMRIGNIVQVAISFSLRVTNTGSVNYEVICTLPVNSVNNSYTFAFTTNNRDMGMTWQSTAVRESTSSIRFIAASSSSKFTNTDYFFSITGQYSLA